MKTVIRDSVPDGDGTLWELKPRVISAGPPILVVGPDRVGKTTVVRRITELTEIPSFKCPVEKQIFRAGGRDSLVFDYMLCHFVEQTGYRFVSDRAYPCEWVYSRVFDRETSHELLSMIDERHANLGTKILYLYSSEVPAEPDDLVPTERYNDVKETYDDFCEWTGCKVTAVDTWSMLKAFQAGGDISVDVTKLCLELMGVRP